MPLYILRVCVCIFIVFGCYVMRVPQRTCQVTVFNIHNMCINFVCLPEIFLLHNYYIVNVDKMWLQKYICINNDDKTPNNTKTNKHVNKKIFWLYSISL